MHPSPTPSHRKRLAFHAVLAGIAVGGVVLVMLAYYVVVAWRHHGTGGDYSGGTFMVEDPELGYAHRPDTFLERHTPPAFTVFTDGIGCRVGQAGLEPPAAGGLLSVGGSFTWGYGVDDGDTFTRRLARRTDLPACNAGFPGYGTTASLLTLRRFGRLAPRVVVYGFITSHIGRSLLPCAPSVEPFCRSVAFVDFDAAGLPFVHEPLPVPEGRARYIEEVVLDHGFGARDVYWAVQRDLLALRGATGQGTNAAYADRPGDPHYETTAIRFLVTEMAREARALDAQLVVVYIPIPGDVKPPPEPLLAAVADHADISLVDMTAAFTTFEARHGPQSLWASPDDSHPNAAAHALIADALEPIVRATPISARD